MTGNNEGIKGIGLDARIALEKRLLNRNKSSGNRDRIPVVPRDGPMDISPAQHRMWFFDQVLSVTGATNVVRAERMRGPVDIDAMRRAFDNTVARHETLRSRIDTFEGVPKIFTASPLPFLAVERTEGLPPKDRPEKMQSLVDEAASKSFNLAEEPPLRAILYDFGDQDFLLVYVIHHIACDEWSIRTFQTELAAEYAAFRDGSTPDIPKLSVQYADFVAWQNAELEAGHWDESLTVLKEVLKDAPTRIALPYKAAVGPRKYRGRNILCRFDVPFEIAQSLDALGRKKGATPFMTMLAVVTAYLHRVTGQPDLAVMSLSAARTRPELEGLIGIFTNNIVIRTTSEEDPSFAQILEAVRDNVLLAIRHQDMPFDILVRELEPEHVVGEIPYGSVMFTHRHDFPPAISNGDVNSEAIIPQRDGSKFDLWVSVIDTQITRKITLTFDDSRFDEETVQLLGRDLEAFIASVNAAPDARLSRHKVHDFPKPAQSAAGDFSSALIETQADQFSTVPTETEIRLSEVWREVLKSEPENFSTSFFDSGGDSLLLMQLVHRISEIFKVRLKMLEVFWDPTVRGIARQIDLAGEKEVPRPQKVEKDDPSIVYLSHPGSRQGEISRPIPKDCYFIVSGAGGHVLPFAPLARRLADDWLGIGLLDPAFLPDADRNKSIPDIARQLVEKARHARPEGPYLLAGYSYGGYVALEMANQLAKSGAKAGVVMLDTRLRGDSFKDNVQRRLQQAKQLIRSVLEVTRLIRFIEKDTSSQSALYDDIQARERQKRRAMTRRQRMMSLQYAPMESDIPVVVLKARQSVRPKDFDDYGWSLVSNVVEVILTEGDHLDLFKGGNETGFAESLDQALCRLEKELGD